MAIRLHPIIFIGLSIRNDIIVSPDWIGTLIVSVQSESDVIFKKYYISRVALNNLLMRKDLF